MSNEIESYSDLKKALEASEDNSLFLGNGFNMSIGIDTSYKRLFEHIQENGDDAVKIALENYEKEIAKNRFCIEAVIDQITPLKSHKALIMRIVASLSKLKRSAEKESKGVNKSTQDRIREKLYMEVVHLTADAPKKVEQENFYDFLSFFQKYFTINYDPTLYRLLNLFRTHGSKQGRSSQVDNEEQEKRPRFSEEERNHISKSLDTDPWQKLHGNTKNSIRKQIGEDSPAQESATNNGSEPSQDRLNNIPNDGFSKHGNKGLLWGNPDKMNVFYLHGAMHIYEKDRNFCKIRKGGSAPKLTEEILEQYSEDRKKSPTCVFQATAGEKEKVIQPSKYLKHCLEGLKNITGNLVIIGWSCLDCDDHLIKAIRESDVENIYISYYSGEGGNPEKDQQDFKKAFEGKNVLPFDSEILSSTLKKSSG